MADIVPTLFGLTPEAYQQSQAAQADKMALEFAKLSPMQQAQFAIGRGAYQLGGAIGGALGGQDPELQIISTRNAIAQQIDYTNPESMASGIQALSQAGDTVGAMQLSQVLRQMQSEMALRQQRQAAAGASQAAAAASVAQIGRERAQAIPGDIAKSREVARLMEERDRLSQIPDETGQTARQIQYIDAQISELRRAEKEEPMTEAQRNAFALAQFAGPKGSPEFNKTYAEELRRLTTKENQQKISTHGQELVDAGLTPGTEPFQKRMLEFIQSKITGTAKGTGNVSLGGISLGGISLNSDAAGKAAGKIVGENVANIENQYSLLTGVKDAISLVNQGIYAGAFGPEQNFIAKYTGIGDPKKVRNTEVFLANIGEIVIPRLVQFGGNDSNEELKYLKEVVGGNQRLEPESIKRILISAERKIRNNLERLRKQAEPSKPGEPLPTGPMNPQDTAAPKPTKRWNPVTKKLEPVTGE